MIADIHAKMINFVLDNSTIVVDSMIGFVDIKDIKDSKNHIFLQGDEAFSLISNARRFYDKNSNVTMTEAYALYAYLYVDSGMLE